MLLNGLKKIEEININNSEKPTIAPINLFIYSVQVLNTLNSSASLIRGSFVIFFAVSVNPIAVNIFDSFLFFSILPFTKSSLYDSGSCSTDVGGIKTPKHLGQSGHPIPDPVHLTTPPANIRR